MFIRKELSFDRSEHKENSHSSDNEVYPVEGLPTHVKKGKKVF